jgi:hypothetical protein
MMTKDGVYIAVQNSRLLPRDYIRYIVAASGHTFEEYLWAWNNKKGPSCPPQQVAA